MPSHWCRCETSNRNFPGLASAVRFSPMLHLFQDWPHRPPFSREKVFQAREVGRIEPALHNAPKKQNATCLTQAEFERGAKIGTVAKLAMFASECVFYQRRRAFGLSNGGLEFEKLGFQQAPP